MNGLVNGVQYGPRCFGLLGQQTSEPESIDIQILKLKARLAEVRRQFSNYENLKAEEARLVRLLAAGESEAT